MNHYKHGGVAIGAFVTVTLGLILVATMWVFGWGLFSKATADFRGSVEQRERIFADGDYRIAAYEEFFDLCMAAQNTEATIKAQEEELATASEGRQAQIRANLTAIKSQRAALINEYNSKATREDTRANFHASNLPHRLDPNKEETVCEAPSE